MTQAQKQGREKWCGSSLCCHPALVFHPLLGGSLSTVTSVGLAPGLWESSLVLWLCGRYPLYYFSLSSLNMGLILVYKSPRRHISSSQSSSLKALYTWLKVQGKHSMERGEGRYSPLTCPKMLSSAGMNSCYLGWACGLLSFSIWALHYIT